MWSLKKETNKKPQTKPQQWQKAPKNSLWHMLNVPLLLIVTEDNFSFLCFRYREVSRLPSVHLTTQPHKPSNVLVSVLFPHFHATLPATTGRRALGQPPYICFIQKNTKDIFQELFSSAGSTNYLLLRLKSQNQILQQIKCLTLLRKDLLQGEIL